MENAVLHKTAQYYAKWALANFFVLALAGALLRYLQLFSLPINYQFLLHAHSHFAFSAWMFLVIMLLFYKALSPSLTKDFQFQFKGLFALTILISYGMLVSFFFTGYQTLSIVLSALFVFATYWGSALILKSGFFKANRHIANILLIGALICLLLSSLGPYVLAYFRAKGFENSAQQNAIYFYLHFQLNGFMQLASIGFLLRAYWRNVRNTTRLKFWMWLLVVSTFPLYAMFLLWHVPSVWMYLLTGVAALLHLAAWLVILFKFIRESETPTFLIGMALIAITLQLVFQCLVALPQLGAWAFACRNLIIGYVHLLTLGSLTPIFLDLMSKASLVKTSAILNRLLMATVIAYLGLLFVPVCLASFGIYIPNLGLLLFTTNLILPVLALVYLLQNIKYKQTQNIKLNLFID